jgi:hypothetical protein
MQTPTHAWHGLFGEPRRSAGIANLRVIDKGANEGGVERLQATNGETTNPTVPGDAGPLTHPGRPR